MKEEWIVELTESDSEIWSSDIDCDSREEAIQEGMKCAKNEKRNKKEATPLIEEKKKILKDLMGSASNQQIDFNKVRDEWRDNR